jgi:hypothetical protein
MKNLLVSLFLLISVLFSLPSVHAEKIRTIVTTDGEVDDQLSFHRFLMYSNEWDIEGLIYTSSRYHWKYPSEHEWRGTRWMEQTISEYARVLPNLQKHKKGYPAADDLLKRIKTGNIHKPEMTYVGDAYDTEGSDFIKDILLDSDERKVYIQAWGGTIAIAQALWRIKASYPDEIDRVTDKVVIMNTSNQDSKGDQNCSNWIINTFPEIQYIRSWNQFYPVCYGSFRRKSNPYNDHDVFSNKANSDLRDNHGLLMANMEGCAFCEGDNVCFYYLIPNGLNEEKIPSYGNWGGRYERKDGNYFTDAKDDDNVYKPVWRWSLDFQNDFFARADWCIQSYEEANHNPVISESPGKIIRAGRKGTTVQLNARATDPDGDQLSYSWSYYAGPSSYQGSLTIDHADTKNATFEVPTNKKENAHIILEVKDDGEPALKDYDRVIVQFNKKH